MVFSLMIWMMIQKITSSSLLRLAYSLFHIKSLRDIAVKLLALKTRGCGFNSGLLQTFDFPGQTADKKLL